MYFDSELISIIYESHPKLSKYIKIKFLKQYIIKTIKHVTAVITTIRLLRNLAIQTYITANSYVQIWQSHNHST